MENVLLYGITIIAVLVSFTKDKNKTLKALLKAVKSLQNILPQFLSIVIAVSLIIAFLDKDRISLLIGEGSGFFGVLGAAIIGSITLIPGFVAFPAAAELLENGASIAPIAAFVSSLMMVGIVTMPLEISYFGKKVTIIRNSLAFIFSIIASYFVSWAVSI